MKEPSAGRPVRGLPLPTLSLQRWLVLSHVVVLALPLVTLYGTGALAHDLEEQTHEDLDHQASLLALHIGSELGHAPAGSGIGDISDDITHLLVDAKQLTLAGFRVVDGTGVVVASSGDGVGDDIGDEDEVRAALTGSPGLALRPRPTDGSRTQPLSSVSRRSNVRVFVARPVRSGGQVVGAVVLSRTPREEWQTLWQMAPQLWAGALFALLTTTGFAFVIGYFLSRSVARLSGVGARIAAGEMGVDAPLAFAENSRVVEVRDLAASLRTMSERLRERLSYISDFAANVSHEFKTPVSSLLGMIEILRDDQSAPELTAEQKIRFLDNGQQDLERLSRLVSGLLRLARAEEGSDRELLDLTALARDVAARLEVTVVEAGAGAQRLLGNAAELRSVLTNLIENAQVHGGGRVWVELVPGGFDVVDDGAGISAGNLPQVFDRFFTTRRDVGGPGLGLAFVRAVVVAHGGKVGVTSTTGEKGRETRLSVRLPGR